MVRSKSFNAQITFLIIAIFFTSFFTNFATAYQIDNITEIARDTTPIQNDELKSADKLDQIGYIQKYYNEEVPENIFLTNKDLLESDRYQSLCELSHEGSDVFIVQFNGPIYEEWLIELAVLDITILDYLPDFAFIIRGDHDSVISSTALADKLSWIGEYKPIYKIDRELLEIYYQVESVEVEINVKIYEQPDYLENVLDVLPTMRAVVKHAGWENNIIRAELDAGVLMPLMTLPEVEWIERYYEPIIYMNNIRNYTGAEYLHFEGFNGTGIVGEVKDDGFDQTHPDFAGQIKGTDGTITTRAHGTCTFGIVFSSGKNSNQALGMLPGAKGVMASWSATQTNSIRNLVNNWGGLFQSNSWGTGSLDGVYSSASQENDKVVFDYNVSVLFAAGNSNGGVGQKTLDRYSVAKNIITVGGVNHKNTISRGDDAWVNGGTGNTPSQGPAADGRIKPDICGPFDSIYTTDVVGSGGYTTSNYYSGFGGTSGATPVVAGTVGIIYQMYRANHFDNNASNEIPAPATVKAILIADAYQYSLSDASRIQQGWGTPDLKNIYDTGKNHLIVNETDALKTGTNIKYSIKPLGTQPLKITLAWTDVSGTTSSSKHLKNDLDLKVIDPSGNVYYGNYDLNNSLWSSASATPRHDGLNNVENVFIQNPAKGKWTIEVSGYNVPQDGDIRTAATDQAFALVASGVLRGWQKHDLAVNSTRAPLYAEPDKPTYVNATIFNAGISDEYLININLTVNGTVVNTTTLGVLINGTETDVELSWKPTVGIHIVSIEITPVSGELETDNNINTTFVIVEPDAWLKSIENPNWGFLNENMVINASIQNLGKMGITDLNVTFSVNGTVINWTLINLAGSAETNVSFNWTPKESGWINITIEAVPDKNETLVDNNNQSVLILITPYDTKKVFILDSWGNDNPQPWNFLNNNWWRYGMVPLDINYSRFNYISTNDIPITYQNLTNSGADVVVISEAYGVSQGWQFSDTEIADIKRYVEEGHGLVITALTFYSLAPNNYKFAPVVGIRDESSTNFYMTNTLQRINTFIPDHPLLTEIPQTYSPIYPSSVVPEDRLWDDSDMDAGVILAGNITSGNCAIIDNHGAYYISHYVDINPNQIDFQLLYNALSTSNYTKYNVDLSLRNITGKFDDVPFGDNLTFNISVHNSGQQVLNNVNVTLYVNGTLKNSTILPSLAVGTYTNLTFKWTADELGYVNVTINVTPFAGETYIYDNYRQLWGTILPNPEISVNPTDFELELNETETKHTLLEIHNTGLTALGFSLTTNVTWISLNITEGSVKIGGTQSVNVTYSASGLKKGQYFGRITVRSNDIDEPVIVVPIHLIIYGQLRYIIINPVNFTINSDVIVAYIAVGYNMTHGQCAFNATWDVTDPAGWITPEGLYYPGLPGNWTVYCNESDGFVSNSTTVNIEVSLLDHIDVTPDPWSGTADDTVQFTATGRNASNGIVQFSEVWTTDDPWGTVDSGGLYRPGKAGT
ncbi:MAG: S8 family serine peptidase, partial [Thermoplasmata archaeon]